MQENQKENILSRFLQSKILLYVAVFVFALRIIALVPFLNIPFNIFFADITESALDNLTNQAREAVGLNSLIENTQLDQAAAMKARNMVQNNYFSHTSPEGITPWHWFSEAGYNYKYAGENLAVGFYDSQGVYSAWLNSSSHRANILNPNYKEVGTAVLKGFGPNNAIVVVQLFGSQNYLPDQNTQNTTENQQPPDNSETQGAQEDNKNIENNIIPEQVLSENMQPYTVLKKSYDFNGNNFYSEFVNFLLYDYSSLSKNITYGVSFITIGLLLTVMLFSFKFPVSRRLIFRSVVLVVIISAALLADKNIIISLIPHKLII